MGKPAYQLCITGKEAHESGLKQDIQYWFACHELACHYTYLTSRCQDGREAHLRTVVTCAWNHPRSLHKGPCLWVPGMPCPPGAAGTGALSKVPTSEHSLSSIPWDLVRRKARGLFICWVKLMSLHLSLFFTFLCYCGHFPGTTNSCGCQVSSVCHPMIFKVSIRTTMPQPHWKTSQLFDHKHTQGCHMD